MACRAVDIRTDVDAVRVALADLKLDQLLVAYPGAPRYKLAANVEVIPLPQLVGAK